MIEQTFACQNDECRVLTFQETNPREQGIPYRDGSCPACGGSGFRIKVAL